MDFERLDRPDSVQIIDLAVGDCIRLGNQVLTVVDIDGQDVCFRIDAADELISIARAATSEMRHRPASPR